VTEAINIINDSEITRYLTSFSDGNKNAWKIQEAMDFYLCTALGNVLKKQNLEATYLHAVELSIEESR
jgi:hypothetical protein